MIDLLDKAVDLLISGSVVDSISVDGNIVFCIPVVRGFILGAEELCMTIVVRLSNVRVNVVVGVWLIPRRDEILLNMLDVFVSVWVTDFDGMAVVFVIFIMTGAVVVFIGDMVETVELNEVEETRDSPINKEQSIFFD